MNTISSRWFTFNGWNASNVPGLQVYSIDPPGQSKRTLSLSALARRNSRKLNSAFYQGNTMPIGVYIGANGRDALEMAMDTLYANIQALEGNLIVPKSGSIRQYTATYSDTAINSNTISGTNNFFSNLADLILLFECSDSFGYDTTSQTIFNVTNQTSQSNTYPWTQGGTALTQVPVVQIQLNTTPGLTTAGLSVSNNATGQSLTVNRTWAQYDLITIDSKKRSVQVNGSDVVFSGSFPEVGIGPQSLVVTDSFLTRNYRFILQVQNRYV